MLIHQIFVDKQQMYPQNGLYMTNNLFLKKVTFRLCSRLDYSLRIQVYQLTKFRSPLLIFDLDKLYAKEQLRKSYLHLDYS